MRKIPWRGGHGNPLQYSCLGNLTDRGGWWAAILRVAKSRQDLAQDMVYLHVNSLRRQFRALRLLLRMCFSHLVLPAGPEGGRAGSKLPSSLMCRDFKDLLVLSTFFFEISFYWSIVALSCCASFCHTAKRVRYTHTHTHTHTHPYPLFFSFLSHLGHHRALSRVPCAH